MANFCTVDKLGQNITYILLCCCGVALALGISIPLGRLLARNKPSEKGVYQYSLAFANSAYMGDPLVLALFGDLVLSYYKLYCLPISLTIYTWGLAVLVPQNGKKGNVLKKLLNPPMVAMLVGIAVGLSGLGAYMPAFLSSTMNSLKNCMGPVAMLLVGFTVASYPIGEMLKQKSVYVATLMRLCVMPAIIITAVFGLKTLANLCFGLNIDNTVLFLSFFAVATPAGLNSVVFPESFGGDPKPGASIAMISHVLGVLSLPLFYAWMTLLFGKVA
jgi:predicted permease